VPLKQKLWEDTVSRIDVKPAVMVSPRATIREAVAAMQQGRTGCLCVVEDDRLVGIFTERDLLKRVIGTRTDFGAMISSVMSASPATTTTDETIGTVLQGMRERGYRHLPVVDKRGRVLGRISVREIVHYMVEYFPTVVYNLPPRPDQVDSEPEGA
jgi:CBS domain-containing protein